MQHETEYNSSKEEGRGKHTQDVGWEPITSSELGVTEAGLLEFSYLSF